jgi:pre-mRNA-processing factor 19
MHKASSPGVLCVDIHPTKPELIVTGGVDKTAVIFNTSTTKKVATLTGHTQQVNCSIFHPQDIVFTGSDDATLRVWTPGEDGDYENAKVFSEHKAPVVECCLHPTNSYVLSVSKDSSWGFYDYEKGNLLTLSLDPDRSPYSCTVIHPDGYIFATGTQNNLIRIWDLRTQKNVATFQGHQGSINNVKFSENGIHLASCSMDNSVKIWDLRGPSNINTLNLDLTPTSMNYDNSGLFLAVAAGREIRIFMETKIENRKELQHAKTLDDHTDNVTSLKFGPDSKFLVSTSMDRTVKLWSE